MSRRPPPRKTGPDETAKRAAGTDLGGRPRIEGPQISHIEAIRTMAGYGLTQEMMATILGWSHDTFTRRKKDDPEVARALEEGKAAAAYNVSEALYNKAIGWRGRAPETAAIRWYDISRQGYRDRMELSGSDENPIVTEIRDLTTSEKARRLEQRVGELWQKAGLKGGNGNGAGRRKGGG